MMYATVTEKSAIAAKGGVHRSDATFLKENDTVVLKFKLSFYVFLHLLELDRRD